MDTFQVRVASKQLVAEDICSFELEPDGEHPLPAFAAGSHIDVLTATQVKQLRAQLFHISSNTR